MIILETMLIVLGFLYCIGCFAIATAVMFETLKAREYENNAPKMLKDAVVVLTAPASLPFIMAYEYFKLGE